MYVISNTNIFPSHCSIFAFILVAYCDLFLTITRQHQLHQSPSTSSAAILIRAHHLGSQSTSSCPQNTHMAFHGAY